MLRCSRFEKGPQAGRVLERLMNKPPSARAFAAAMGASRNTLFLKGGQMVRIVEFPEGARPVPMTQVMEQDPKVKEFLKKLGSIVEDGFDPDVPGSLEAFN